MSQTINILSLSNLESVINILENNIHYNDVETINIFRSGENISSQTESSNSKINSTKFLEEYFKIISTKKNEYPSIKFNLFSIQSYQGETTISRHSSIAAFSKNNKLIDNPGNKFPLKLIDDKDEFNYNDSINHIKKGHQIAELINNNEDLKIFTCQQISKLEKRPFNETNTGGFISFLSDLKLFFIANEYIDLLRKQIIINKELYLLDDKLFFEEKEGSIKVEEYIIDSNKISQFDDEFKGWIDFSIKNEYKNLINIDYLITDPGIGHGLKTLLNVH